MIREALRKLPGPSRRVVAALCFPMAALCFFFTWLNGHLVPDQVVWGILIGIFFIVSGIGLFVKDRRLKRRELA